MTAPIRGLLVGANAGEITALGTIVAPLLHPECELLAIEADTSSVDPMLAWGTAQPAIRTWVPDSPDAISRPAEAEPLSEDGDTWKAVIDAAHRHRINIVAVVERPQGWFGRLLSGSAAQDLIAHGDLPIIVVPLDALRQIVTKSDDHGHHPVNGALQEEAPMDAER